MRNDLVRTQMRKVVSYCRAFTSFSPDFYDRAKMRAFRRPLSASGITLNLDTTDSQNGELY